MTVAANGKTVHVSPGQALQVRLESAGGMLWRRPTADSAVLRLASADGGYPRRGPVVTTFVATAPGRAILRSLTDAACLHARPPCGLPQRSWHVTVVVARS